MKKHKKRSLILKVVLVLLLTLIAVSLASGVYTWQKWRNTTAEVVPDVPASAFGIPLEVTEYVWSEPVLFTLVHKSFSGGGGEAAQLGSFEAGTPINFKSERYDVGFLTLERDGERVFYGNPDDPAAEAAAAQPGAYLLSWETRQTGYILPVEGSATGAAAFERGWNAGGTFIFRAAFTIEAKAAPPQPETVLSAPAPVPEEPEFILGRNELAQGDIFAMRVLYLPEGIEPKAETELGEAVFTLVQDGWFACVAVGNIRPPGEYPVRVTAGEWAWEATVTVLPFVFDEQNLIIDETQPAISEANSPRAIEEYNNVMLPMYESYDGERYWDGLFIQPTQGRISTQFGEIRYTNSDYSNPRPHWGMDIAAAEGSEVIAAGAGRVVFSDYLLAVGHTIIIEHGGGLKSYYYHMSARHVEAGEMVATGDLIGEVGSTGYSTGAHLHFEMRIGGRLQVISPSMLFEGTAGLYSTEPEAADTSSAGAGDE